MNVLKLRMMSSAAVLGMLAACSSGCMVSPLDGDTQNQASSFQFAGGTTGPNETVEIQAWHPQKGWTKIAETRSSRDPYPQEFYGETYYLFTRFVVVPSEYWRPTSDMFEEQAEVRCVVVGPGGKTTPVLGFRQNLWTSIGNPGFDLIDVLDFSGNGTSVTIYSPTPIGP